MPSSAPWPRSSARRRPTDELPAERRLGFRIGIHVGDVMIQAGDLFGDGVNIAARIQTLAGPGGICLSATVLEHVHKRLPHGVVDLGRHQVKNIDEPIARLSRWPASASRRPRPMSARRPALAAAGDRPSIAVLPFTNIGGDPEQEYFADGLVEEIITSLSRVRSFFVIARNSSFTYKGRAVDVRQVARELGVRYVLEGSIRKAGTRVRIVGPARSTRPAGTTSGPTASTGDVADIFELQDRVTESVVGSVEPSIRLQEIRQARAKPTSSISAYDLYLRALPRFYSMTREGFAEVRRLTNEALAVDPDFHLAKALGAYIRSISVSQCWHEPDDVRRRGAHGARGPRRGARRPDLPALRRAGRWPTAPRTTRRRWRDRALAAAQPQLGAGLYRRRLGQRPCRPTPDGDRAFPPCDAPEPARSGEGHRALRHRHELPHAAAVTRMP